ncbi:MAG: RloB domain-containing protein [Pirellulales bacterium]|nr:RloB domain-containing protein [Pirellulales bacterium]
MGNARDRKRRPGRRPAFREPKPTILIVTEGKVTEPEYIEGFRKAFRNTRVRVEIAKGRGVPRTLVETAKELKKEAKDRARQEKDEFLEYDSVWCVFDIDDHPAVGEVKEMARDNGIDLAISNPCFELWLLLHFTDNPGMQDRTTMRDRLKKFVPGYRKHVDYATYSAGYEKAVKRAAQMDDVAEEAGEPHRNPTTGVYKLTELIRE